MKTFITVIILNLGIAFAALAQKTDATIITSDIDNFWAAFDKITATKDSALQYQYLNQLFIAKGTPGLRAIMQVRQYTPKSYIDAINQHPLFWASVRPNTLKANTFALAIAANVVKLKKLYPELHPAKIYFTIGAFRTGGTTLDSMILIGSELSLADEHTVMQEFGADYNSLKTFLKTNPINNVVFTNVHEYVHTQQNTKFGNTLLAQCVLEGVAEFLAVQATGQASTLPALAYGHMHHDRIRQVFAEQMFNADTGFWLYSNDKNEFGMRDLGYYVGYTICERYYKQAKNKQQSIRQLIEMDYNNEAILNRLIDESGYLSAPVQSYRQAYEDSRPQVTGIGPIANHATNVDPAVTRITVEFSAPMNKLNRNFELGPLGMGNLMRVKHFMGFAEDGRSVTFEVELQPAHHYQLVIGDKFYSQNGASLKHYLIDFTTAAK